MKPICFVDLKPIPGEGLPEYMSRTLAAHRTDLEWKAHQPSLNPPAPEKPHSIDGVIAEVIRKCKDAPVSTPEVM